MDAAIGSAARALRAGDPLTALKYVGLLEAPAAVALRGIALAQLGDYERSRRLLRVAARRFGAREPLERARCQLAEAEIALATRDLQRSARTLDSAARTLELLGDQVNALHAKLIRTRRLLLLGRLEQAERALDPLGAAPAPAALAAVHALTRAEIALRRARVSEAEDALRRAAAAARAASIPALLAQIESTRAQLSAPCAQLVRAGVTRLIRLDEVEALFTSGALVVDGCRRALRASQQTIALARRPVLFALLRCLAEAWPADVPRDELLARGFGARRPNPSLRARLRVELGRLRATLRPLLSVQATRDGFLLVPGDERPIAVLTPPREGAAGAILALLAGGEAWSTSALASALGASQRSVQRALRELDADAAVRALGQGRSRRWVASAPDEFATVLLLPGALPVR